MSWGSLWQHEQPRLKGLEGIKESFIFQIENRSMLHSPPNLSIHSSIVKHLASPLLVPGMCFGTWDTQVNVMWSTVAQRPPWVFLQPLINSSFIWLKTQGEDWPDVACLGAALLCSIPLPWHLLSRWGSSWVEKVVWFSLYHFSLVLGPMLSSFWKNLYSQSLLFYVMSSTPAACQTNLVSCSKIPVLFKNLPLFSSDGLWRAWISFFSLIKLPRLSPCETRGK